MTAASGISYVVITSVDRDDLEDLGAGHYARCIEAIGARCPDVRVEVLTPDFQGRPEAVRVIAGSSPDVFAHNIETVRRLHRRVRDARAGYEQSLSVLRMARDLGLEITKSGLMVGHGESREEILEAMADLRDAGVDLLTIGQYLQPTTRHLPVERMWTPREFDELRARGEELGFRHVAAGPLVRSSYRAGEHLRVTDKVRDPEGSGPSALFGGSASSPQTPIPRFRGDRHCFPFRGQGRCASVGSTTVRATLPGPWGASSSKRKRIARSLTEGGPAPDPNPTEELKPCLARTIR